LLNNSATYCATSKLSAKNGRWIGYEFGKRLEVFGSGVAAG